MSVRGLAPVISGTRVGASQPSTGSPQSQRGTWVTRSSTIGTKPRAIGDFPVIEIPTNERQADCPCSWVVVRVRTTDSPSLSRLKYPTMICPHHGEL